MTSGSLAYVINDGLVRRATDEGLDVYQALFLRGCLMVGLLATAAFRAGHRPTDLIADHPARVRVGAEVVATACFFAAIIRLEFANAQTILMLVPFAVTLIAARRLGESVAAARYGLIGIGFLGVLAVVRPTPSQFSPWALLVIVAALCLVVREFATRQVDPDISPLVLALMTAIAITSMTGLLSAYTGWGTITGASIAILIAACCCLIVGYFCAIQAVRVGDLSVSAPFRYTAVVGAVIVGYVLFEETPDPLTWFGCTLIVGAGVLSARADALSD
ncbi:MAG: DMT family transporter [Actinomycetota bacterium]